MNKTVGSCMCSCRLDLILLGHSVTNNSLSLSLISMPVHFFLHLCLRVCATYADPGVFQGLCGSDAFTGVDG